MSKKIDYILEVLNIVEHRYLQDKTNSIVDLRVDTTTEIAERLGLWRTTVLNSYQRGLEPDVYGTKAFDSLTQAWLTNASPELQNVLLKHASDDEDRKNIASFFGHDGPKNEKLLSHTKAKSGSRSFCLDLQANLKQSIPVCNLPKAVKLVVYMNQAVIDLHTYITVRIRT